MDRKLMYYISLVALLLLCCNCSDDAMVEQGTVSGEKGWVTLPFGHTEFEQVDITTRSTLGEVAESRVKDLYLFIFVDGKCVYNNYFGDDARQATAYEVQNAGYKECWYVSNRSTTDNPDKLYPDGDNTDTHGFIHIRSPKVTGGTLYLVANANAYTVNISPDKLSTVRTEDDLKKLTAALNGDVVTRYGYFPMVGKIDNVTINKSSIQANGKNVQIPLERLDAKVQVNIKAATGHYYMYAGSKQTVKDFTPESWRIVNVPKGAFLLEDATAYDGVAGYFNSSEIGFETIRTEDYTNADGETKKTSVHGFSFYMLENRYTATGESAITDGDFYKRDLRNKNADGTYVASGKKWVHAPEESTYMEIKGFLSMEVGDIENEVQELGANVTYYIHLGDFNQSVNNYAIERNTCYTYNITIKGVNKIQVEVATSNDDEEGWDEPQPGAAGTIFVSQQASVLLDAHYSQYVSSIDVDNLDVNTMSWYVNTPFGKDGSPKLNGIDPDKSPTEYADALKDYDYKWIWFMINPYEGYDSDTEPATAETSYRIPEKNEAYSEYNQWYPGDACREKSLGTPRKLMNVEEFVTYMREQKTKHSQIPQEDNIFRDGKVFFTVFVDEFYYEKHPIEGETSPQDLWKQFVGQPNRLMHILCGSSLSLDGESSATNSVITIRQRSIQTPYNTTKSLAGLPTAWGCEVVDETEGHFWFYNTNTESTNYTPSVYTALGFTPNNIDEKNGRYNTACLWGVITSGNFNNSIQWRNFLTYHRGNAQEGDMTDDYFLRSEKRGMLYVPLTRNRDNDGDGVVDADEIRWYIASIGQLNGLYMGEPGMKGDARLYPISRTTRTSNPTEGPFTDVTDPWRIHIVSSTSNSAGNHPRRIWAEEGISTENYGEKKGRAAHSIRCIRNLGMDFDSEDDARTSIIKRDEIPTPLIKSEYISADGSYQFDLSNINEDAIRSKTEKIELEVGDETSYMARVYYGFQTGESVTVTGNYPGLKNMLDAGISPCPEGYRTPNIREGALMALYCGNWSSGYYLVNSYYSLGDYGTNILYAGHDSWIYQPFDGHVSMSDANWNSDKVRCVRDWDPSVQ